MLLGARRSRRRNPEGQGAGGGQRGQGRPAGTVGGEAGRRHPDGPGHRRGHRRTGGGPGDRRRRLQGLPGGKRAQPRRADGPAQQDLPPPGGRRLPGRLGDAAGHGASGPGGAGLQRGASRRRLCRQFQSDRPAEAALRGPGPLHRVRQVRPSLRPGGSGPGPVPGGAGPAGGHLHALPCGAAANLHRRPDALPLAHGWRVPFGRRRCSPKGTYEARPSLCPGLPRRGRRFWARGDGAHAGRRRHHHRHGLRPL